LQVQDISHVGETAASALKHAMSHPVTAPVVIVEIGGNDILGTTTSEQFSGDLDALLAFLAGDDRQIVMFELPLPPFCHEYGRVQRAVAARHNVLLVPRRVFLSVIAGSGSTLDTIHLSQSGHQYMSDLVWTLIKSAFDTNPAA
jgi:acyl-CoA thioesterase-1